MLLLSILLVSVWLLSFSQLIATVSPVYPVILPVAALSELATCVTAQASAAQVMVLKVPPVLHVAIPLPVYPSPQVTATVSPVFPLILPVLKLSCHQLGVVEEDRHPF